MEKAIIHVKVQFDPMTRTFRIVVPAFEALVDPDALYDLSVPVSIHEEPEAEDLTFIESPVITHT